MKPEEKDDLEKLVKSLKHNLLVSWILKIPESWRIPTFAIVFLLYSTILISAGGFFSSFAGKAASDVYDNVLGKNQLPETPAVAGVSACSYEVCSDFKDDQWINEPGIVRINDKNEEIPEFKAVVTDLYRGGTKYLKKQFGTDLKFKFTFAPTGGQVNQTLSLFDSIEYIIGDAGDLRIACVDKKTRNYITLEGTTKKHIELPEPIKRGSMVEVVLTSQPILGTNKVRTELEITKYYSRNDGEKVDLVKIPTCIFEVSQNPEQMRGRIGVGLLDWNKTNDVKAEFQSFQLQENLK